MTCPFGARAYPMLTAACNPMLSGPNAGLQARIQVEAKQPVGWSRSADRVGDHAVVEVWTNKRSSSYHTTTGEAIPGAPCNMQVVHDSSLHDSSPAAALA